MPFGPTNAPTTFQSLMNKVLHHFLCWVVIFYDILIYSSYWSVHLQHVKAMLDVLHANKLFVNRSKCH